MKRRRSGHLLADRRGAAMVEFLAAFLPILLFFLCIIELARLAIAELMVQRAAGIAVRACAVIKDQPLHCDTNHGTRSGQSPEQDTLIALAASEALRPVAEKQLRITAASCTTEKNAQGNPRHVGTRVLPVAVAHSGLDRMQVEARFRCVVPLARDIVCPDVEGEGSPLGRGERSRRLRAAAEYGHQGARYDCWFASELEVGFPGLGSSGSWEAPEW